MDVRLARFDGDSEFNSVMWGVHCLKQDLQDLSDFQEWTSLLPETPIIELPNYLLKLHLTAPDSLLK